ncbi:hypothetical protein J6590_036447 [Homalodisca vitripennis]|nr:hypothetical protein J6590_036447 [Homalodisca vitripennis]
MTGVNAHYSGMELGLISLAVTIDGLYDAALLGLEKSINTRRQILQLQMSGFPCTTSPFSGSTHVDNINKTCQKLQDWDLLQTGIFEFEYFLGLVAIRSREFPNTRASG